MANIKISKEVSELESKKNKFDQAPAISIDNADGRLSVIDTTDDSFTGDGQFISIDGDVSNVVVKVSGLQKNGSVASAADIVAGDVKPFIFWKDNQAYDASDADTLNKLILSDITDIVIRLGADINTTKAQAVKIPVGRTVTIDLNGHSLTSTGADGISNKGNLTIKGAGKVSSSAKSSAAIANFPDATVNLSGGEYSSALWYPIKNLGSMTIDGDVQVSTVDSNPSSLIDNGWVNSTDAVSSEKIPAQADKASLHIISGTFKSKSSSIIKNDDYGILVIDGGTFDCTNGQDPKTSDNVYVDVINWNEGTINGGTFIGGVPLSNGGYGADTADHGLLTVNGGEFGGIATNSYNVSAKENFGVLAINGGDFSSIVTAENTKNTYTIKITGGTFVNDVSSLLVDGATITQKDNKFIVTTK